MCILVNENQEASKLEVKSNQQVVYDYDSLVSKLCIGNNEGLISQARTLLEILGNLSRIEDIIFWNQNYFNKDDDDYYLDDEDKERLNDIEERLNLSGFIPDEFNHGYNIGRAAALRWILGENWEMAIDRIMIAGC